MSNVPPELRYTQSHEWVRTDGNVVTIGITDHAQKELTDIVFVELPDVGRTLNAGEACAVVESVKTASDIYSPVSGKVIEINKDVVGNPALANNDPYEKGWLFKVKFSDPTEVNALMTAEDYASQIGARA
jgi:glycine cleavage system H protein